MQLTKDEKEERQLLEIFQKGPILMPHEQIERLKYLRAKEFHNCCSNVRCTGYHGIEEETICPVCQSALVKSIDINSQTIIISD